MFFIQIEVESKINDTLAANITAVIKQIGVLFDKIIFGVGIFCVDLILYAKIYAVPDKVLRNA